MGYVRSLNKNMGRAGPVQSSYGLIKCGSDQSDPTHFTSLGTGIFICCFRGWE
ncbi:hypothetical protein TorRG33x02_344020, partial [Trema orientale]